MDVVAAIMNDHRVLEGLFDELDAGAGDRVVLIAEVRARLRAHTRAEERYVYPVLARIHPDSSGRVHHGVEEHREAEAKLAALETTAADDFPHALGALVKTVREHIGEEESSLLPALQESLSVRKRDDLGRRFESHRISELRRAGIDDNLTKEDLYIKAQRAGIAGRSSMSRGELARALLAARTRAAGR